MRETAPEILLRHAGFVRGLARALTRDEHETDDAVQQTWVAALSRPPQTGRPVRPWLAAVVRNAVRRLRRDAARRQGRERRTARSAAVAPTATLVGREEILRLVVEEVVGLREPYRETVLLHYYEGLSYAEIATRRGVALETVRSQLKRARSQLRSRLDRRCNGVASWLPALAALVGAREVAASPVAMGGLVMGFHAKVLTASVALVVVLLTMWMAWPHRDVRPRAERFGESDQETRPAAVASSATGARADAPPVAVAVRHTVRGRVLDRDDTPIEGATVFVGAEEDPFGDPEPVHVSPPHLYGRILRTADDGGFAVSFDGPRHVFVWLIGKTQDGIRPAGWRTEETTCWVDTPADEITFRATVLPTARLVVRLHDQAEGSPVPAFKCRFTVERKPAGVGETVDGVLEQRLVLPENARTAPVRVDVTLDQPAVDPPPTHELYLQVGAEVDVDLVLLRGGRVRGVVVDREGRAVANALVFAGDVSRGRGHDPFDTVEPRRIGDGVRTGPDGTFELVGVGSQRVVTVWSPAHATTSVPITGAGRIELAPRGGVHGVVLDREGAPIGGLRVAIIDGREVDTDERGTFAFDAIDPGYCGLKLARGRFLGVRVEAGETTEVVVEPGIREVVLEPLAGGHPFGERLRGAMGGQGPVFLAFEARFGDGPLHLEDVWPGRYLFLGADGRVGWADVREEHAVLDLGEHRLAVRAEPRTRVFLVPAGVPEPYRFVAMKMASRRVPADGEVVFTPLPAGRYDVCTGDDPRARAVVDVPGEPVTLE